MRRRDFLRSTSVATAGFLLPRFVGAMAGVPATDGRKLVVVQLTGGNDWLNTLVPYAQDAYYRLRPQLAIPAEQVLRLGDHVGLNPVLAPLRPLFDDGLLCILNNVGYPQPDRSHFRSMDIWHTASESSEYLNTGWLGRVLDTTARKPHHVVEFGGGLSLANKGERLKAIALSEPQRFHAATREPYFAQLAAAQHKLEHQQLGYLYRTMAETYQSAAYISATLKPQTSAATWPKSDFAKQLRHTSSFIRSGMETRVYYTSLDGFDTHVNQAERHKKHLGDFANSVAAFWQDLRAAGQHKDVVMMVFSEFGRRTKQNSGKGTDHGAAGNLLLIGEGLRKPGVFNPLADLASGDDHGDPVHTIDFRSVYAALLRDQLDVDPALIGLSGQRPLDLF